MTVATSISPVLDAQSADEVLEHVKNSGSSFLIGMMALPKSRRLGMFGLYAFCRAVDDIADSDWPAERRMAELATWRGHVSECFKGQATHPVMQLLLAPIKDFSLAEVDFQHIIEGMEMDGRGNIVAPTWEELDAYCDCVASAVGRVSVRIFGEATEQGQLVAYHLGRALQLTNILRDVDEDAARGRLYLPREAIEEAGIENLEIATVIAHPLIDHACRAVARRAATHFEEADMAMRQCDRKAMKPARLMRDYYERVFTKMLVAGWEAPRYRIGLGRLEKIGLLLRALF